MLSRVDLLARPGDFSLRVDHVGNTPRIAGISRVASAIRQADLAVRVAEQREGKLVLGGKSRVFFHGVEADPENFDLFFLIILDSIPEPETLGRSATGVGLGIKPDDYLPPSEIAKANCASLMILNAEVGGYIAYL